MSYGWENGSRVPAHDPREDNDDPPVARADPAALIMARRLVGFLLADAHPALGIECMALVTSIGYRGDSMADIARRHNVSRATVSARCVDLCESFGIPPTNAMRSTNCRSRCRQARVREMVGS